MKLNFLIYGMMLVKTADLKKSRQNFLFEIKKRALGVI